MPGLSRKKIASRSKSKTGSVKAAAASATPKQSSRLSLTDEVRRIVESCESGHLSQRVRADLFKGKDREIVEGINAILDTLTTPLARVTEYFGEVSEGKLPSRIVGTYHGDLENLTISVNRSVDVLDELTREMALMSDAHIAGEIDARIPVENFQGSYRAMAKCSNDMVDKLNWYQAIIDAVQFPIHVIDKDMNWVFLNKAFEKLMVDNGIIRSRKDAPGMPCSSASANICKTENCGLTQLAKGNGETYFDWHGQHCKQESSKLVNTKGEHIGYVEVVQDLTSIVRNKKYTENEVSRVAGNLTKLAAGNFDLDLNLQEADRYTVENKQQFGKINESLSAVKSAVQTMAHDADQLTEAAVEGNFESRANAAKHQGEYRQLVAGINGTMDVVVDKLNWYQSILDAVQFPIHVIDKDMNWVFLNKAFEKLMVDQGIIRNRKDAPGMPCSSAAANICKTENCGLTQLAKGNGETYFDWHGQNCKQESSKLVNIKGEHIGYVEVVQDLTSIVRNKNYTENEVTRVAGNLTKLAQGNFDLDLQVKEADKYTVETKQQFAKINENFASVKSAVEAMAADARLLAQAGTDGKLATRADASKHHGDFRKIVEGVNSTLDAVIQPVQDVQAVLGKLSDGDFTVELEKKYAGDFEQLKQAVNAMAKQVRTALVQIGAETGTLASASEQLGKVSQQMSASAEETATQANVVSAASEQVSTNIQTVATGADEMGASIKEIAKNTADATKIANNAVQLSQTTNETVRKLGASSAEIGQVIKVITSIAQQTNLAGAERHH